MDKTSVVFRAVCSFRLYLQQPQSENDKMLLDYIEKCFESLQNGVTVTKEWLLTHQFVLPKALDFYNRQLDEELAEAKIHDDEFEIANLRNTKKELLKIKTFIKSNSVF